MHSLCKNFTLIVHFFKICLAYKSVFDGLLIIFITIFPRVKFNTDTFLYGNKTVTNQTPYSYYGIEIIAE